MINRAEDEPKQAKFIAKLESQGIFPLLQKWGQNGDEDINNQITVFQMSSNSITSSETYQLEVHKNRSKELELHTKVLERKIEDYKE